MTSRGFIVLDVLAVGVVAANSDGYMSPGADMKDSAGELSNLTSGEVCSSHADILTGLVGWGRTCRR